MRKACIPFILATALLITSCGTGEVGTSEVADNNSKIAQADENKKELKEININDYIVFDYYGYEQTGKCTTYIDHTGIVTDNLSSFGLNIDATSVQINPIIVCLEKYLIIEEKDHTNISNGDEIQISFDTQKIEELNKAIIDEGRWNVQFTSENVKVTIDGFEKRLDFDISKAKAYRLKVHYFDEVLDDVYIVYECNNESEKKLLTEAFIYYDLKPHTTIEKSDNYIICTFDTYALDHIKEYGVNYIPNNKIELNEISEKSEINSIDDENILIMIFEDLQLDNE